MFRILEVVSLHSPGLAQKLYFSELIIMKLAQCMADFSVNCASDLESRHQKKKFSGGFPVKCASLLNGGSTGSISVFFALGPQVLLTELEAKSDAALHTEVSLDAMHSVFMRASHPFGKVSQCRNS